MRVSLFWTAVLVVIAASAHAVSSDVPMTDGAAESKRTTVVERYTLPPTDIATLNPGSELGDLSAFSGRTNPGIGSALVAVPGKAGEFLFMTDRGPNDDGKAKGEKIFPVPAFTPAIVRARLANDKIEVLEVITLKDGNGKPITGLPNGKGDELALDVSGKVLPFNPSGMDAEAMQLLPDGRFLVGEEYAPSVAVINKDGRVLVRYVPEGVELPGAGYPVKPILPAIFKQRRANRGIENLAMSPDGKTAWAILQSPLGDPKDKRYANTRVVRAVRMDIGDPLAAKVTGMFLLEQSPVREYPHSSKQSDLKYSDAVCLDENRLLVLERAEKQFRLIRLDLSKATNLLGMAHANSLEVEEQGPEKLGLRMAKTERVMDSGALMFSIDTDKMEGLAVLGPHRVAITNDNDFGIGDNTSEYPSRVWVVHLHKALTE